jgi:hypothetical protein
MASFCTVVYDFDSKKTAKSIPIQWVFPNDDLKGQYERRYLFYHTDLQAQPPATTMLQSLLRGATKENPPGFLYLGNVIKTFGKSISNKSKFKISYNSILILADSLEEAQKFAKKVPLEKFTCNAIRKLPEPSLEELLKRQENQGIQSF